MYIAIAKRFLETTVELPDKATERFLDQEDVIREGFPYTSRARQKPKDTMKITIKNRYRNKDGSPKQDSLKRIFNIIYPYVKLNMDAEEQRRNNFRTMLTQERIDAQRRRLVTLSAKDIDSVDIDRFQHLWDRRTDIVGPTSWRTEGKTDTGLTAEERGIEIGQGEFADAAADRVREVIEQDADDDFDRTDEEDAMESYERQMVESAEAAAGMENVDLSDLQGSKEERDRLLEDLSQVAEGDTHMEEMLWNAQQKQRQEQYTAEQRKENPDASMRELREAFKEKEPQTFAEHKQRELEAQMTGDKLEEEAKRKLKEREAKYGTAATRAADTGKTPTRKVKIKPESLQEDKTKDLDWPNFQEEEE